MSALRERLLIYAENHLTTADELRAKPGCEMLVRVDTTCAACLDAALMTSGSFMMLLSPALPVASKGALGRAGDRVGGAFTDTTAGTSVPTAAVSSAGALCACHCSPHHAPQLCCLSHLQIQWREAHCLTCCRSCSARATRTGLYMLAASHSLQQHSLCSRVAPLVLMARLIRLQISSRPKERLCLRLPSIRVTSGSGQTKLTVSTHVLPHWIARDQGCIMW